MTENQDAFYAQLAFNHRVNKALTYALSAGRTIQTGVQLGLYNQILDYYFARWSAYWDVIRHFTIGTGLFYEDGTQVGGVSEDFIRWGVELNIGRSITKKLSAGLSYRFFDRESDLPNRDYVINSIFLNCTYRF